VSAKSEYSDDPTVEERPSHNSHGQQLNGRPTKTFVRKVTDRDN